MTLATVLCVLLLAVSDAFAFNEPDGFRGVPFGASEAQMRKTVTSAQCENHTPSDRWIGDRSCVTEFRIGSVAVDAIYYFRGGKFVRVSLHFDPRDFGRLVEIFKARYGAPTASTADNLVWAGEKVNVSLRRYVVGGNRSAAGLTTVAEMKETQRLRDEQTKGAAKSL